MNLKLTLFLLATTTAVMPSLFGALLEESNDSIKDVSKCVQQVLTPSNIKQQLFRHIKANAEAPSDTLNLSVLETVDVLMKIGYVETFTFKDWGEAYEMGDIVRVLLPYFNPEDLTSYVGAFMQGLRDKIRYEFDGIVPLELRNPGLTHLYEDHPLRMCVSIVDSRVDLEKVTSSDKDYLAGIATFLMAQDTLKISALAWKNLKTVLLEKMESLRNSIRRHDIVTDFRRNVIPAREAYHAQKGKVRDDLVRTMRRLKKNKTFSESVTVINNVLQSLNKLGRAELPLEKRKITAAKKVKEKQLVDGKEVEIETETPVTIVVVLQRSQEPWLIKYINVIREAVSLLKDLGQRYSLNFKDLSALETAEKILEHSPNDIVNELNSHTRRISKIPFDEALAREIALLNASDKAEIFYQGFLPKVEAKIKRLLDLVDVLDQLGERSFQEDFYHPPSQSRRIVRELEYITRDDDPKLFDPAVKVLTKTWQESLDKIPECERKGVVHVIKSTSSVIGGSFMEVTQRMIIPADVPEDARFVRKTFTENNVRKTRWVAIY